MSDNLMTSEECAQLFGVSVPTIERWAREEKIPSVRPVGHGQNRILRFDRHEIAEHIKKSKIKAREQ